MNDYILPECEGVSVRKLQKVFSQNATSYKFFLFRSILNFIREDRCESIEFDKLHVEMLTNAWFPKVYFKLNFGAQDKLGKALQLIEEQLQFRDMYPDNTLHDVRLAMEKAAPHYKKLTPVKDLTRYSVFRVLKPWFEDDLKNLLEYKKE